jgi:hypothetical protein
MNNLGDQTPVQRLTEIARFNKAKVRTSFNGETGMYTVGYFEGEHALTWESNNIVFAVNNVLGQIDGLDLCPVYNPDIKIEEKYG